MSMSVRSGQPGAPAKLWEFFSSHPGILLTLFYLYFCFVGSVHKKSVLASFGINYFDFAEASDLLLTAFHDSGAVIVGVSFLLPLILALVYVFGLMRGTARDMKGWQHVAMIGFILFLGIVVLIRPSWDTIGEIRRGWGTYVKLQLDSQQGAAPWEGENNNLLLIATTARTVFLYGAVTKRTYAVTTSQIVWQVICTTNAPFVVPEMNLAPEEYPIGTTCIR
jgi:hypothetical protein